MEARQTMINEYNKKLHYHDENNENEHKTRDTNTFKSNIAWPSDQPNEHKTRDTNTFKSNIAFSDPATAMNSNKGAKARQRQFESNPL